MCRALLIALFTISIIMVASLRASPVLYVDYVEIMEWDGFSWRSTYIPLVGGTLSFTTSARLVVVRTDSSSGKQPAEVLIDGARYNPTLGTGVLWNTAIVQLDGSLHRVSVRYVDSPSRLPALAFFATPGGSTDQPLNVSIPRIPGFVALGLKVKVLLRGNDTTRVIDRPFFVLNSTTVNVLGEALTIIEALVPFENASLRGGFIRATYSYLYGLQGGFGSSIQLPPYPERYLFLNSPSPINLTRLNNLVKGTPPKVFLAALSSFVVSLPSVTYTVNFNVEQPSTLCGASSISYRVLAPRVISGPSGRSITLSGDNTTLVFRFFSRGVSLVDVVVSTPPGELSVSPPIYSLSFVLYDKMGGRVRNAYFTVYSTGKVIASGVVRNGEGLVCPLPPGEYVIVAYVANNVIARTTVQVAGDTYLPIITNTTSVQITILREGTQELLGNYTITLRSGDLVYNASGVEGRARIEGVLPGVYAYSVYIDGDKVYEDKLEVSDARNTFVFSIPVYRLRVQLVGALNQPLGGLKVVLQGLNIKREATTDLSGRVDFGLVPAGSYELAVEEKHFNITVSADSFKLVQLDVVAVVHEYKITTGHVEFATLVLLLLSIVLAVRRIVKSFKREESHIVEV